MARRISAAGIGKGVWVVFWRAAAVAAALFVLLVPDPAVGGSSTPGFVVGFADDLPQWDGAPAVAPATQVGASAFRFTLQWRAGERALTTADRSALGNAVPAASAFRVVLSVYGATGADAPVDATGRSDYCAYVGDALTRFPSILDVVIWNEPNKALFWNPAGTGQSQAPAQYEALLASCYDSLHAAFPGVNVLGLAVSSTGNDDAGSTSPGAFIRAVGDAYRASGRTRPLLDTVSFHPYPLNSAERPWVQHIGQKTIGEGDWNKLMYNLWLAFDGTAQALPGSGGVAIWYLEDGFQTTVPAAKAGFYSGTENVAVSVPDSTGVVESSSPPPASTSPAPDQATQILDAMRLAACQPAVGAFFNFMLVDDTTMTGWQSGAFWADRSAKASLPAFQQATAEARGGNVDCGALKGGRPSSDYMPPAAPAAPAAQVQTGPLAVTLSWSATTDDVPGTLTYRIFRNGSLVATTTSLSWTNTNVAELTTYGYSIRALDQAGNLSDPSPSISVTTPDVTAPSTPAGFTAQADPSGSSVTLAWQPATDNVGVSGYAVSRDGVPLATVVGTGYTDGAVTAGSSYGYSLVALDAAGNQSGAASTAVTLSAPPPAPVAPANTVAPAITGTTQVGQTLTATPGSWTGTTPLAFAYQWQRCSNGSCAPIASASTDSYTATAADAGSTLRVAVTAGNSVGSGTALSPPTTTVAGAPAPPVPAPAPTPAPVPAATGGGGGGGGGGSSSFALVVTPPAQTVPSGSAANWTVSVTNTGGAYLYAVGVTSDVARGCGIPSSFGDIASLMPPGVTIGYSCSLAGASSSVTSTFVAKATTGPGDVLTQTAGATVDVQTAAAPASGGRAFTLPARSPTAAASSVSLRVTTPPPVRLSARKPKILLSVSVSRGTTLVLKLLDPRSHLAATWTRSAHHGMNTLNLLLPARARVAGRDTLRIGAGGTGAAKVVPVHIRS